MKTNSNLITGGVTAKLRSMILAAELKPGNRLVEEDLSRLLGVGRTPVREALLLLQGEGYVARTHRGWEVRGADSICIHSVFESRAAIEAASARLAARKLTPIVGNMLETLLEEMEPGENVDRLRVNALNNEFHQLILNAADNEMLSQFHERAVFHYWALRTPVVFSNEELKMANRQHRDLLDALRQGSEEEAERCARLHVEKTSELVAAYMQAIVQYETIYKISALEATIGMAFGRFGPGSV